MIPVVLVISPKSNSPHRARNAGWRCGWQPRLGKNPMLSQLQLNYHTKRHITHFWARRAYHRFNTRKALYLPTYVARGIIVSVCEILCFMKCTTNRHMKSWPVGVSCGIQSYMQVNASQRKAYIPVLSMSVNSSHNLDRDIVCRRNSACSPSRGNKSVYIERRMRDHNPNWNKAWIWSNFPKDNDIWYTAARHVGSAVYLYM